MGSRLQKILSASGLMSRRKAEEAILDGRVTCNGKTAVLGDTAEDGDVIKLDGKPIPGPETKQYFLLNKPRGYVCTMQDEKGRKTVRDLLPASAGRVYPVGRLDLMSEGLLLMTNDGEFAFRIAHPSGNILKTYRVTVTGADLEKRLERMSEPFILDGNSIRAVNLEIIKKADAEAVFDITIREGKNREIRRMCEISGLKVKRLIRIREGDFSVENLSAGMFRCLTEEEITSVLEA